jgi:FxLD family lantipeptide
MTPPVSLLAPASAVGGPGEDEFRLDLRVIESAAPLVVVMCSTDDECGSTCAPSACATASNDPS